MRLLEKIVLGIVVLALVLKVFGIVGGGALVVLSLSLLSVLYMFFGWWLFKEKKNNVNRIGLSIAAGFGLSSGATGLMYKLQCWPGAGSMLTVAVVFVVSLFFIFLVLYLGKGDVLKKNYDRLMMLRIGTSAGLLLITLLIPLRAFASMQYFEDGEEKRLYMRYIDEPTCVECYHEWMEYRISKGYIRE